MQEHPRQRKRLRVSNRANADGDAASALSAPEGSGVADQGRGVPAVEHVLVQQWGFTVTVRVLPPLWAEPRAEVPSQLKSPSRHQQLAYLNPLYLYEETSTSSYSDTGEHGSSAGHCYSASSHHLALSSKGQHISCKVCLLQHVPAIATAGIDSI